MRISIIGVGYVGLVSGACFSDFGHDVICIDKDKDKISNLNNGLVPIYEPGLESLIKKNIKGKRLSFQTDLKSSIKSAEVIFIAVGTPINKFDDSVDLSSIFEVVNEIKYLISSSQVVVIKSTVPVGTNSKVVKALFKDRKQKINHVVSNPEFLREGSAIEDFMKPDRIVIGLIDEFAKKIMKDVYRPLYLRDFPIVFTSPESAEIIKYASNSFLATKISFINEVASLCEEVGANVKDVSKGMGLDGRIGDKFLHAGPGYGGSCFPKDTVAFTKTGREHGVPLTIVEAVVKANQTVKLRMLEKILSFFDDDLTDKTLCIFGVTFKPNTDDMREAPSLTILPELIKKGFNIRVVDPKGKSQGESLLDGVTWYDDPYDASKNTDLVVILTEWNEFRALDLRKISDGMRTKALADLRNIYSRSEVISQGFDNYISVGR